MNLKGILDIAVGTDTGRVRTQNEDSIRQDAQLGTVMLADGMGGYKGGEVASSLAVSTILKTMQDRLPGLLPGTVDEATGYSRESILARESILKANQSIYKTSHSQPQYHGMGTTLVMAIFYDNRLTIAHIGDSRLYRCRQNQLDLMTVDHTLVQELIDRGFYSREEAYASLNKNLVTRALGIEPSVAVDIQEDMVMPRDIYMLCSDGLNDMISDTDIANILRQDSRTSLDTKAGQLIQLANDNGGKDNVSVVLAQSTKPFPASRSWSHRLIEWLSPVGASGFKTVSRGLGKRQ